MIIKAPYTIHQLPTGKREETRRSWLLINQTEADQGHEEIY